MTYGKLRHQLLAGGQWFPPGTLVSSTRKLISSSSFHRLDMTLAFAEALNPNKSNHLSVKSLPCIPNIVNSVGFFLFASKLKWKVGKGED